MPPGDKIQRTTEAQLVAQKLRLFSALHVSGEDTGPSLGYRLHQRQVL